MAALSLSLVGRRPPRISVNFFLRFQKVPLSVHSPFGEKAHHTLLSSPAGDAKAAKATFLVHGEKRNEIDWRLTADRLKTARERADPGIK